MEVKKEALKKIIEGLKKQGSAIIAKVSENIKNVSQAKKEKTKQTLLKFVSSFTEFTSKLAISIFPFLGAFYPTILSSFFWIFIIILIVIIIVWVLFKFVLPALVPEASIIVNAADSAVGFSEDIKKSLVTIILLVVAVFIVSVLPSPNYPKLFLQMNLSSLHYHVFLLILLVFALFIPLINNNVIFLITTIVYTSLIYFIIPFILLTSTTACLDTNPIHRIPFISDLYSSRVCKDQRLQKTTLVVRGKEITIPYSGGLSLKIGYDYMNRLPAGYAYREVIFITNYYTDPENKNRSINIYSLNPYIYYPRYNIYFVPTDFVHDKTIIKPGETYGKIITFNPEKLQIIAKDCPYTKNQITALGRRFECSFEVPCNKMDGIESKCVEVGYFDCKCINWINVTCSGGDLYVGVNVTHNGFIIGNGTLYYFEDYSIGSLKRYKYIQGPATISFNFVPNPWIRGMYEGYIDSLEMFGDIQIIGREPKITSLTVTPVETKTIVYDYFNNKIITETIGISPISCVSIDEINELLTKTGKWNGLLCKFTPPQISLEIIDMKTNETSFNASISLAMIDDYCKYNVLNISENTIMNFSQNYSLYREYLRALESIRNMREDIKTTISEHGLCSIIKGSYVHQNETLQKMREEIRSALREINVYVRLEYVTTSVVQSSRIPIYWTSKCG